MKAAIDEVTILLLIIFNSIISLRLAIIYLNAQHDPDQDTKKIVTIHIKAAIIVNLISGLVYTIAKFYK
jgi:hypothetical protein